MFFNKENNRPQKQEIDQSFFDDLRKFYKTGDFKEENKEKLSEYYIDNNKFQINENIKNNCFSFMDKSSFTIQYNEKEYLVQHFFDKDYYKNDEVFNITRLNHVNGDYPNIELRLGNRNVTYYDGEKIEGKVKQFFSKTSIPNASYFDIMYDVDFDFRKNIEKEVENEYSDVIEIINKHFNKDFNFHEHFTFTFDENFKDGTNTLGIDIYSTFDESISERYEIDLNKKEKEIYLIDYDVDDELMDQKIYSSRKQNVVGTEITICEVDLEKFSKRLYELITFVNNEKYNFMDFDYKSFDDFKNSVKNIKNQNLNEHVNEYEK